MKLLHNKFSVWLLVCFLCFVTLFTRIGNVEVKRLSQVLPNHSFDKEPTDILQYIGDSTFEDGINVGDDDWPPSKLMNILFRDYSSLPRRVVVAASSSEYVEFADNFGASLLALNVTNFVFVPLDKKAYTILRKAYPAHTLPPIPGQDSTAYGPATYGSDEFKRMTATRPVFLRAFLEKGYTVFYNDIDIVWQHDAWRAIDLRMQEHSSSSKASSKNVTTTTLMWQDGKSEICTCMMYMAPAPDNIALIKRWEAQILTGKSYDDQLAFNLVARGWGYPLHGGSTNDGVHVYRNDEQFPAGNQYIWDPEQSEHSSNEKAIIIHNNWVVGKEAKRKRFEKLGLWRPSGRIREQ